MQETYGSKISPGAKLVPGREILREMKSEGRAVAALNFYNAETLRAHIEAANSLDAPIFLQTTESTIRYLGLGLAVAMARAAAEECGRPIALHLDHGGSYELAERCVEAGYTSVMIDGSKLPFAENCTLTRRVVEMAHAAGVSVEGELGHVAHNDESGDTSKLLTDPADARRFIDETGVDSLAVAVGTAHGFYKGEVKIDFGRLAEIREAAGATALVLHGGSGVGDDLLARAVDSGISKINFGTELKNAFTQAVKASLMSSDDIDLRRTFAPAIEAVKKISASKILVCQRGYRNAENGG
jgi:ketose-bisphosphate aldolase